MINTVMVDLTATEIRFVMLLIGFVSKEHVSVFEKMRSDLGATRLTTKMAEAEYVAQCQNH